MVKPIRLPDGTEYQFPDDVSDEEIASAIESDLLSKQPISQGGTPLNQQSQDGSIAGGISLNQPQPGIPIQQSSRIPADQISVSSGQSQIKSNQPANYNLFDRVASSVANGVSGGLGLVGDAINFLEDDEAANNKRLGLNLTTGRDIRKALSGTTARPTGSQEIRQDLLGFVPDAPFQSTGGRILGGAISGAASGLGIGGIPMAAAGAIGGAAQQGAAEAGLPVPAQIAAGLLGGGLGAYGAGRNAASAAKAAGKPSQGVVNLINQATTNVDPSSFERAIELQKIAENLGSPLTGAEAISQVTGGNNQLQSIQRYVEQSRRGAPITEKITNNRAARNDAAIQNVFNKIGAPVTDSGVTGQKIQKAAQGILDDAEKSVNDSAAPLYNQVRNTAVPTQQYISLIDDPFFKKEIKQLREDALFEKSLRNVRDNEIGVLDLVKRRIDDQIGTSLKNGDNTRAKFLLEKKDELLSITDPISPTYVQARGTVESGINNIIDPLKNRPIGSLSRTGDFDSQASIILDPKATKMTPELAKSTIENLISKDPQAAQTLIRQSLENHFNEATRKRAGGNNQFGGANFASEIQGNKQQAKNLQALFSALPDGNATYNDFRRLIDVFEAQGKRLRPNSATKFNDLITEQLGPSGVTGAALQFSTVQPISFLNNFYTKLKTGQNVKELANLLTNPNSVQIIQQLRKIPTTSPAAAALIFTLLRGQQANNP